MLGWCIMSNMNTSTLFSLNWSDIAKGLVMAVLGAVLTALYQGLIAGTPLNVEQFLLVGATAGLSYVIKNFFSDSSGKVFGKIG